MSQLRSNRTSSSHQSPRLPTELLTSRFPVKTLYEFPLLPPCMPHSPASLIFLQFGHFDNSTKQWTSLCCFPQLPVTWSSAYLLQHPLLQLPRPMFYQCAGSQWDNEYLTDSTYILCAIKSCGYFSGSVKAVCRALLNWFTRTSNFSNLLLNVSRASSVRTPRVYDVILY
jgi:hypothetical protein